MTKEQVQILCREYKITPQKSKGQNFLIDDEPLEAMVAAANIRPGDVVLEVGPGFGVLTQALVQAGATVVAVELDLRLIAILKAQFAEQPVTVHQADILALTPDAIAAMVGPTYKVVTNLPYNITSIFLRKFLEINPQPQLVAAMVQKEVAERVVATPGDLSILAVAVQYYCTPEIVTFVPKDSFWPQPLVDSAILLLKDIHTPKCTPEQTKAFFRVVRMTFAAKRKKIHNTLAAGLHIPSSEVTEILANINIDSNLRAQDLTMAQWQELTTTVSARL